MSNDNYTNMPNFRKVFEAWDQKPTTNNNGWTFAPAIGTFGQGPNSHYTYSPDGKLDHYSVYDGFSKLDMKKF